MNWLNEQVEYYKYLSKHGRVTVWVCITLAAVLMITGLNCIF
jgi:hypothetical protein